MLLVIELVILTLFCYFCLVRLLPALLLMQSLKVFHIDTMHFFELGERSRQKQLVGEIVEEQFSLLRYRRDQEVKAFIALTAKNAYERERALAIYEHSVDGRGIIVGPPHWFPRWLTIKECVLQITEPNKLFCSKPEGWAYKDDFSKMVRARKILVKCGLVAGDE